MRRKLAWSCNLYQLKPLRAFPNQKERKLIKTKSFPREKKKEGAELIIDFVWFKLVSCFSNDTILVQINIMWHESNLIWCNHMSVACLLSNMSFIIDLLYIMLCLVDNNLRWGFKFFWDISIPIIYSILNSHLYKI